MDKLHRKQDELKELISSYGSGIVAYSSGVDSTYLLTIAREVLGEKVLAVTATSALFPVKETDETVDFCRSRGIEHVLFPAEEMKIEGFEGNPIDRCYICKKSLFSKILDIKEKHGLNVVMEGSNTDDDMDYRPGSRAIAELGIRSPLKEVGLSKEEIRLLSRELELSTWDKPSFACLASRIPYGEKINSEKLSMVERAEEILSDLGFAQYRVRIHENPSGNGQLARIEIMPDDFNRLIDEDIREIILEDFRKIGFRFITLDLIGYRMGSMNEGIQD